MRDLLLRLRIPLLLVGIVVLTVATMVADRRAARQEGGELGFPAGLLLDLAAPVQATLAAPAELAQDLWGRYVALLAVRRENERLRERIAKLREENLQYREALVASGRLQRIAEMRRAYETPMVPAEVAGQDLSVWYRSVLLDRGRSEGVRAGMPVVTDRGLVGLVTATSGGASQAMLLLDRQSAVDGLAQRSRAQGIVRGRGDDRLEFEFAVRGSDVREGDVVITSGLGGVHPKGLRVGEVVEVAPAGELLQTAVLRPAVDFGRLEGVFVMLWRAPTMDLLYGPAVAGEGSG